MPGMPGRVQAECYPHCSDKSVAPSAAATAVSMKGNLPQMSARAGMHSALVVSSSLQLLHTHSFFV